MAKIQRATTPGRRKKFKPKDPKSLLKGVSQSRKIKRPFPHLCRPCYELTSRLSEIRPSIPEAFKHGLRFQRRLPSSNTLPCSFCSLLFESLLAHNVNFDFQKLVNFVLVAPGPEEDTSEALFDLCTLDLYLEGSIRPSHHVPETYSLGTFMVSAKPGERKLQGEGLSLREFEQAARQLNI
jgi:hypothetical protein